MQIENHGTWDRTRDAVCLPRTRCSQLTWDWWEHVIHALAVPSSSLIESYLHVAVTRQIDLGIDGVDVRGGVSGGQELRQSAHGVGRICGTGSSATNWPIRHRKLEYPSVKGCLARGGKIGRTQSIVDG